MVRIDVEALWLALPTADDVLLGRESLEGLEALGEVVRVQEVVGVLT